jgi:hypothetical protein
MSEKKIQEMTATEIINATQCAMPKHHQFPCKWATWGELYRVLRMAQIVGEDVHEEANVIRIKMSSGFWRDTYVQMAHELWPNLAEKISTRRPWLKNESKLTPRDKASY